MPLDKTSIEALRDQLLHERGQFETMIREGEAHVLKGRVGFERSDGALVVLDKLLAAEGRAEPDAPAEAKS